MDYKRTTKRMKKILIVYPHMAIGGSTTSLLSILNLIDYKNYGVDLLLGENRGELISSIPDSVNILEQAMPNPGVLKVLKMTSFRYIRARIKTRGKSTNIKNQYMTFENARFSRKIHKTYDVAIAFLETYACDYVATKVNAKKKIFWLHLDYIGAGFDSGFDRPIYRVFDRIVLVSQLCKSNFDSVFPEYKDKTIVIENILSQKYVRKRATEKCDLSIDPTKVNLISVCRIDFKHKGLDRGVIALAELRDKGIENFHWYIMGDGDDREQLSKMIKDNLLDDKVTILGMQINPAKYTVKMDALFMPSRYEGKPMAVTEAQMLSVPAIVTRYGSAEEQIVNEKTGFIFNNDQEDLNNGLEYILKHKEMLIKCKTQLRTMDFTNIEEMEKINECIEI